MNPKKAASFVIGILLIVGTLAGENLKYITDWSTSELIGYNVSTVVAIVGGVYLIYWGAKKK